MGSRIHIFLFALAFSTLVSACTNHKVSAITAILRASADKLAPVADVAFFGETLCVENETNGFSKIANRNFYVAKEDIGASTGTGTPAETTPTPSKLAETLITGLPPTTDKTDNTSTAKTESAATAKTESAVTEEKKGKVETTKKGCTEYEVTAIELNNRKGPGTSYPALKIYKNGDRVCVTDVQGIWGKLEDGTYLSLNYLIKVSVLGNQKDLPCTDFHTVTASTLFLRRGPGTSYFSVKSAAKGSQVCVVSKAKNWAKLSNNLYCSTEFIKKASGSTTKPDTKPVTDTDTNTDTNAESGTGSVVTGYQSSPKPDATTPRANEVVYYSQKDEKWANLPYTTTDNEEQKIRSSACGPTSMAMAVATLADRSVTPDVMVQLALDTDSRSANEGTYRLFYCKAAQKYKLKCQDTADLDTAIAALKEKKLVVASMRPSKVAGQPSVFASSGGHVVLFHSADDEYIYAHDPNSTTRVKGAHNLVRNQGFGYVILSK